MGNAALFCLAVAVNVSDANYVIIALDRTIVWSLNVMMECRMCYGEIRNGFLVSKMHEGTRNEGFVLLLVESKKI